MSVHRKDWRAGNRETSEAQGEVMVVCHKAEADDGKQEAIGLRAFRMEKL